MNDESDKQKSENINQKSVEKQFAVSKPIRPNFAVHEHSTNAKNVASMDDLVREFKNIYFTQWAQELTESKSLAPNIVLINMLLSKVRKLELENKKLWQSVEECRTHLSVEREIFKTSHIEYYQYIDTLVETCCDLQKRLEIVEQEKKNSEETTD